jgi:hypothetical protein
MPPLAGKLTQIICAIAVGGQVQLGAVYLAPECPARGRPPPCGRVAHAIGSRRPLS